jgi:hypothetical protein
MAGPTIADLRGQLETTNARWAIHRSLTDPAPIPTYSLGASPEGVQFPPPGTIVDLRAVLSPPNNPFLTQRRLALGLLDENVAQTLAAAPLVAVTAASPSAQTTIAQPPAGLAPGTTPAAGAGGGPMAGVSPSVDWRNRFGWPWITTIQDQDGCQSCWDFAATALVESQTRVSHAVWSKRSEGDAHDGMGAQCLTTGWPSGALDWMVKNNGVCDPDCYPWKTDNSPYTPCPDRDGRTVKISSYVTLSDVTQQKQWLDSVGPLTCCFDVYNDFFAYGSGVYHLTPGSPFAGTHCVLLIGYDDTQQAWLVKNSWGTVWGQSGFGWIGYGEVKIDEYSKYGVADTNPDPWTKRRLHNGNLYESGDGALRRNFEMLATVNGTQIRHWWRDNSTAGFPWAAAETFGDDAAACPTLIGTTYNRNFESVHLTTGSRLHHWWYDQAGGTWNDGGVFGPNDAAGIPGFIQGNYGAPGNFEVVVRTADGSLNHWWRANGAWSDGGRFATGVANSGASLVQGNYGGQGNFELVCVLDTGAMQHWWRDNDGGMVWRQGPTFGSGVASPPCMIEGQYGAGDEHAVGNFELCVAVGGQAQHWWRDNQADMAWHMSATFGHDIQAVAGLIEGSFGFNLEVVVLRTDQMLQHYWRDGAGWHEGPVIGSAA